MGKKPAAKSPATLSVATRIAVLVGKEVFLQSEYTAQLRAALAEAHGDVDVIRFDGASAAIVDVLDECRTFGLMQQHKLVVVDQGDQLVKEENRPRMERYAESPSPATTLVLRCERWYAGKLDKLVQEVGAIIQCDDVKPALAMSWAVKRCEKRHGARLDRRAAELLIERIGPDLLRLDTELAKLGIAAAAQSAASIPPGELPTITPEAVQAMVGQTREEEAWAIQETLLHGDAAAALTHLRSILDTSRREAHIPLSWAMADLARKLHAASRGLREGVNPWELSSKLKLWPEHRKEAILAVARRVPPERLARLFKAAVEADVRQKSGVGRPDRILETMALQFARTVGGIANSK
jgi:DNA polymerase III subunit delta